MIRTLKLCLWLALFITGVASTAQPAIEWQRTLGGLGSEIGTEVIQTTDGGYLVVGRSASISIPDSSNPEFPTQIFNHASWGESDMYVVKLDSKGKTQWQKLIGGQSFDWATNAVQTSDGGYMIIGTNGGNYDGDNANCKNWIDYWVVKLDKTGAIQWDRSYGGTDGDVPEGITQTSDGGFIITGFAYSVDGDVVGNHGINDSWVIKINSIGDLLWQKCYGGGDHGYTWKVIELKDKSLIMAGSTNSTDGDVFGTHGWDDYWLIKLSEYGDFQWQKCYGGSQRNELNDLVLADDGGFVLGGYSASTDGDIQNHILRYDFWIVKVNSVGDIEWENSYGGENNDATQLSQNFNPVSDYSKISLYNTIDGGYIVGGSTRSYAGDVSGNHGANDYWVLKIDKDGNKQWQKCFGGSEDDYSTSVIQTKDRGYLVLGYTYSNDGDVLTNFGNNGGGNTYDQIVPCDIWIVKLSPVSEVSEVEIKATSHFLSPSPSNGLVSISLSDFQNKADDFHLEVTNVLGQLVYSSVIQGNDLSTIPLNLSNLSSGIYSVKLSSGNQVGIQKIVIR